MRKSGKSTAARVLSLLCLASTLGSTGKLAAKPATPEGEFGIINLQQIILEVNEGKNARAALEKEIKDGEANLLKQKQELDKMNEDWKTQAPLLSEEARMRKQKEFQEKFMELRNAEATMQNEIKKKEAEATQKIAAKASKIVEGMAKAKKLKVVFETSSAGLVYIENPVDLTNDVVAAYNKTPHDSKVSKR